MGRQSADCDLDKRFLSAQTGPDAIPSLDDPKWVFANDSVPGYLDPDTRVVGIFFFGRAWAVPLNVLWHHEIVNLDAGGAGARLAVTYCPLTGSSLVFDRSVVGGATLGVSGLLFMNNLMLFDREEPEESHWPQMLATAACGPRTGTQLPQRPFVEMEWAKWLALHPSTNVLAEDQGFEEREGFDYSRFGYPYGSYRSADVPFNGAFPFPLDRRLFAKERVLGVPSTPTEAGIAFPFGALTERSGSHQAIGFEYEGEPALLLWSDEAQGGAAFRPVTRGGASVTVRATTAGFEDEETKSRWTVEGLAVAGPMEGAGLVPIVRSHTAFWFAWAAFHPDTQLWED